MKYVSSKSDCFILLPCINFHVIELFKICFSFLKASRYSNKFIICVFLIFAFRLVINDNCLHLTCIKVSPVSAKRWSRSASTVRISRKAMLEGMKPIRGLPWRTAARANRFR